jgi:acetyl esterase/lipase
LMKTTCGAALIALIAVTVPALAETNTNSARPRFPVPAGVKVIKDLEYGQGSGRPLLLDLYVPEKRGKPSPLIIWIHGGAWLGGSKDNGSPALQFAGHGYAVAHVGYRLSGEATFPAQINDCKGAIRWLRSNAEQYNIDPEKFIAWGSSAGGHLAALVGTTGNIKALEGSVNNLKESSRVQAVIDWFGPTDLLRMNETESDRRHDAPNSAESKLIGGPILENKDKAAKASPTTYITRGMPPFLIMHGDHDLEVPIRQSEIFAEALNKVGADVTFIPIKGAGHGIGGPHAIEPVSSFLKRMTGN